MGVAVSAVSSIKQKGYCGGTVDASSTFLTSLSRFLQMKIDFALCCCWMYILFLYMQVLAKN
jgi:hypothetical protein